MIKWGTPAKISSVISTPKEGRAKAKKIQVAVRRCFINPKIMDFYLFENFYPRL
jgi:hypothetical protein